MAGKIALDSGALIQIVVVSVANGAMEILTGDPEVISDLAVEIMRFIPV